VTRWASAGALALLLAAGALRADAAPLSASAASKPAWSAWSENGFEVGLRLSALSVFNAAPLAYSPLELGYRFNSGLRVRTGIELFYYEGLDKDAKQPALGTELYSYEMLDWHSSLEYVVPLPSRLRPIAGLGLDLISGSRHRAVPNLTTSQQIGAWSVIAPGALLGAQWRGGEHWAVELCGRYGTGFTETGPLASAEFGWHYLF
jgi:hypothetical protein